MANINFISARRAERVRLKKAASVLSLGVMIAGGAVLFTLGMTGMQVWGYKAQIRQAKDEIERMKPEIERVQADEKERASLLPMIQTLELAQLSTEYWLGVMGGLKRSVPAQTWLTNIQAARQGEGGQVRITGVTADTTRVGETMLRLNQQTNYYSRVDLGYTRAKMAVGNQSPNFDFELAAQLQPMPVSRDQKDKKEEAGNASPQ